MSTQNILSANLLQSPLVDPKTGRMGFEWVKWFQGLQSAQKTVVTSFNESGQLAAVISTASTISGRGGTVGSILGNIGDTGIVLAAGVDFANAYANKDTDHIADGTGSPLAGGKEAYTVLIASSPSLDQVLQWNGTDWVPVTLAAGGVTQIIAGTNVTVSPAGGTGAVTVNASAGAYLKGTVSVAVSGLSGTFRGTGTVTGATTSMSVAASSPGLVGLCTTNPVNVTADVASANTVEVQVTLPNIGVTWGPTLTFYVTVFP